jgi:hypothetical protein
MKCLPIETRGVAYCSVMYIYVKEPRELAPYWIGKSSLVRALILQIRARGLQQIVLRIK